MFLNADELPLTFLQANCSAIWWSICYKRHILGCSSFSLRNLDQNKLLFLRCFNLAGFVGSACNWGTKECLRVYGCYGFYIKKRDMLLEFIEALLSNDCWFSDWLNAWIQMELSTQTKKVFFASRVNWSVFPLRKCDHLKTAAIGLLSQICVVSSSFFFCKWCWK